MTPCKHICKTDSTNSYCIICYRTLEEITNWMHYTKEQKRAIMKELDNRKAKHESN